MSLENTEKLVDAIITKRKEYLAGKIERWPCNNFRASDVHECDKYMVHSVLDWGKKSMHDEGLQAMFDRGNDEERIVIRELGELGFQFIHQQTPFEIKNRKGEMMCRGKIDGKILFNGEAIPVEIKSMNVNVFNSLRSLEDFQKKPYHRKYLRQMQLYLFGNNEEAGIFILSDLQGHYKIIPVVLDLGECERILQRLERNWKHVQAKTYPEPMDYSDKICDRCAYKHLCLPETKRPGARLIDNKELEDKLEKRETLKESVDEYKSIDEEIKDAFREIPQAFVGVNWQITGQWKEGMRVDTKALPDDVKKKYSKMVKSWVTKILRLDGKK